MKFTLVWCLFSRGLISVYFKLSSAVKTFAAELQIRFHWDTFPKCINWHGWNWRQKIRPVFKALSSFLKSFLDHEVNTLFIFTFYFKQHGAFSVKESSNIKHEKIQEDLHWFPMEATKHQMSQNCVSSSPKRSEIPWRCLQAGAIEGTCPKGEK